MEDQGPAAAAGGAGGLGPAAGPAERPRDGLALEPFRGLAPRGGGAGLGRVAAGVGWGMASSPALGPGPLQASGSVAPPGDSFDGRTGAVRSVQDAGNGGAGVAVCATNAEPGWLELAELCLYGNPKLGLRFRAWATGAKRVWAPAASGDAPGGQPGSSPYSSAQGLALPGMPTIAPAHSASGEATALAAARALVDDRGQHDRGCTEQGQASSADSLFSRLGPKPLHTRDRLPRSQGWADIFRILGKAVPSVSGSKRKLFSTLRTRGTPTVFPGAAPAPTPDGEDGIPNRRLVVHSDGPNSPDVELGEVVRHQERVARGSVLAWDMVVPSPTLERQPFWGPLRETWQDQVPVGAVQLAWLASQGVGNCQDPGGAIAVFAKGTPATLAREAGRLTKQFSKFLDETSPSTEGEERLWLRAWMLEIAPEETRDPDSPVPQRFVAEAWGLGSAKDSLENSAAGQLIEYIFGAAGSIDRLSIRTALEARLKGGRGTYLSDSARTTLLRTATWITMGLTLFDPTRRCWKAEGEELLALLGLRLMYGTFKSFCTRELQSAWSQQWRFWGEADDQSGLLRSKSYLAGYREVSRLAKVARVQKASPLSMLGLQNIVAGCKRELLVLWDEIPGREQQMAGYDLEHEKVAALVQDVRTRARRSLRDAAILAMGFLGLLRPGELGALKAGDVQQLRKHPLLVVHLGVAKTTYRSKHFGGVQSVTLPLPHRSQGGPRTELFWAYTTWIRLHMEDMLVDPGTVRKLFPRILSTGAESSRPPSSVAGDLAELLRRRTRITRTLGWEVPYLTHTYGEKAISGYSLRRGIANFLLDSSLTGQQIRRLGRWSSDTMQGYFALSTLGALDSLERALFPEGRQRPGEEGAGHSYGSSLSRRPRRAPD